MKKLSIYLATAALAFSGSLVSCSDNYLDVNPKTDYADSQLTDESVAKGLLNGIFEAMNTIYSGYEWNQNTGESYVNTIAGDCCGVDYMGLYSEGGNFHMYSFINSPSNYITGLPWMYYYNIVNLSNYLIKNIPATADEPGDATEELLFVKASALTMRAHAYTRLLGYYGNRWEDSDNGEAYSIVLRTEPGTDPSPLVKMNDVLDLIYSDCDQAVKLFDLSGVTRSASYEVNKNVACGVWARAALIKHDWATAADKAKMAREGTQIMEEKELFSGFMGDNSETIWSMNNDTDGIGTWSWGYHYACNGHYIAYWNRGGGAINIDLYNSTAPNDIRRRFFWMPDHLNEVPKSFKGQGNLKEADFWNPELVDYSTQDAYLWMNNGPKYDRKSKKGGMIEALAWWMYNYYNNYFTGDKSLVESEDNQFCYYHIDRVGTSKKSVRVGSDEKGAVYAMMDINAQFGAQTKFWGAGKSYAALSMPWMRASEMALTEAEAYYMLGREGDAKEALKEVQSKRIPNYSCTTSGQALLDEIRISRRMELWGEGFGFTDMKRWNLPHVRRVWVPNDPTSGNVAPLEYSAISEDLLKQMESVTYSNGWRFRIPKRETDYNTAIDVSILKQIK